MDKHEHTLDSRTHSWAHVIDIAIVVIVVVVADEAVSLKQIHMADGHRIKQYKHTHAHHLYLSFENWTTSGDDDVPDNHFDSGQRESLPEWLF